MYKFMMMVILQYFTMKILLQIDDVLNESIITITEQEIQHGTVDRFKYNSIQINVGIK